MICDSGLCRIHRFHYHDSDIMNASFDDSEGNSRYGTLVVCSVSYCSFCPIPLILIVRIIHHFNTSTHNDTILHIIRCDSKRTYCNVYYCLCGSYIISVPGVLARAFEHIVYHSHEVAILISSQSFTIKSYHTAAIPGTPRAQHPHMNTEMKVRFIFTEGFNYLSNYNL